jgi:CheY-like chemotaxis protein
MKCLLVDDEAGIREGLASLLRLKGHDVRTAGDVAAAMRQLQQDEFDAVISDWRLPDGTAEPLIRAATCPVLAVSGHPEEIPPLPNLGAVLQKPVTPPQLLARLAALVAAPVDVLPAVATPDLPADVAQVLAAAQALLGAVPAEICDDGTFVVLRAAPPDEFVLSQLELLGGDLRVLTRSGEPTLELRLFRDGRPDASVPVVGADAAWPAAAELAIDFAAAATTPLTFLTLIDRAVQRARVGDHVHFLNVPDHLRFFAEVSGRGHDMPKRAKPGPRLPEVLANLWS